MELRTWYLGVIGFLAIAMLPFVAQSDPLAEHAELRVPVKYEGYRRCIGECIEVYEEMHRICTEIPVGESPEATEDALDCYSSAAGFRAECTSQCRIFDLLLPPPSGKPGKPSL